MAVRRGVLVVGLLLTAAPAQAHGTETVFFGLAMTWGVPAALLLFVPWHRWWARLIAVLVLGLAAALCLYEFLYLRWALPQASWLKWGAVLVFMFGPPVFGLVTAAMLWEFKRKGRRI
jgi:hypothetical protein